MNTRLPESEQPPLAREPGVGETMRAVAWSFFGVRRGAGYARDVQRLNPLHVVIAGIAGAAIFVVVLVLLVRWVVNIGIAG